MSRCARRHLPTATPRAGISEGRDRLSRESPRDEWDEAASRTQFARRVRVAHLETIVTGRTDRGIAHRCSAPTGVVVLRSTPTGLRAPLEARLPRVASLAGECRTNSSLKATSSLESPAGSLPAPDPPRASPPGGPRASCPHRVHHVPHHLVDRGHLARTGSTTCLTTWWTAGILPAFGPRRLSTVRAGRPRSTPAVHDQNRSPTSSRTSSRTSSAGGGEVR